MNSFPKIRSHFLFYDWVALDQIVHLFRQSEFLLWVDCFCVFIYIQKGSNCFVGFAVQLFHWWHWWLIGSSSVVLGRIGGIWVMVAFWWCWTAGIGRMLCIVSWLWVSRIIIGRIVIIVSSSGVISCSLIVSMMIRLLSLHRVMLLTSIIPRVLCMLWITIARLILRAILTITSLLVGVLVRRNISIVTRWCSHRLRWNLWGYLCPWYVIGGRDWGDRTACSAKIVGEGLWRLIRFGKLFLNWLFRFNDHIWDRFHC